MMHRESIPLHSLLLCTFPAAVLVASLSGIAPGAAGDVSGAGSRMIMVEPQRTDGGCDPDAQANSDGRAAAEDHSTRLAIFSARY